MTPLFFMRPSQAEVAAYIRQIADASPIPIMLYHHSSAPTPIEVETIRAVASHPNIVGMKETNAQVNRLPDLLKASDGAGFSVLQGSEPLALSSFRQGAHGLVGAMCGVIPEAYARLWRLFKEKDEAGIARLEVESGGCEDLRDDPPPFLARISGIRSS